MRTAIRTLLAAAAILAGGPALGQTTPAQPNSLPDWWKAHVDFMSRDGGTWIAPNPANDKDPSQPDAFGMEWRASNDGHLLSGRLYAIEGGQAQPDFWTYREFWHPGERKAVLEQWGGPGVYGVGETTAPERPDHGYVEQTFWLPDGRSWREGHRNREEGDTYVTDSFDIEADGSWKPNGSFTWTRVRAAPQG